MGNAVKVCDHPGHIGGLWEFSGILFRLHQRLHYGFPGSSDEQPNIGPLFPCREDVSKQQGKIITHHIYTGAESISGDEAGTSMVPVPPSHHADLHIGMVKASLLEVG